MSRHGVVAVLLCILVAFAGGCKKDKAKLAVGIAIPSYVHAVAWIGAERGHFDKAGTSVDVQVMGGSAATMRTLIAEQIDIGLAGGDAVLKANKAGADLVVIGSLVDRFYHRIVAREGIDDADDLRGKKIGLPFLGGPQDMAVKVALKKLGLDYDDDVEVVSLGKEFNRMAALQNGEIDASTSQSPDSKLDALGLHVLVDLPSEPTKFPYIVVVARRAWLEDHRKDAKGLLAGLCEATKDYAAHKDESLTIIAKHLGNSDVDGSAHERYEKSGPSLLSMPPTPNAESLQFVLDLMGDADTDPATVIDGSVLDEVIAEGHCQ